jgi:hypothetical protein
MDHKNVGYKENKIGKYVLCENYNAIELWSIECSHLGSIMKRWFDGVVQIWNTHNNDNIVPLLRFQFLRNLWMDSSWGRFVDNTFMVKIEQDVNIWDEIFFD